MTLGAVVQFSRNFSKIRYHSGDELLRLIQIKNSRQNPKILRQFHMSDQRIVMIVKYENLKRIFRNENRNITRISENLNVKIHLIVIS